MQTATFTDPFGERATGNRTTAGHTGRTPVADDPVRTAHPDHVTERDRRTSLLLSPCGHIPLTSRRAVGVFQQVCHRVDDDTPLTLLTGEAAQALGWFGRWVQLAACGSLCWHELTEPAADAPICPKCEWSPSGRGTAR